MKTVTIFAFTLAISTTGAQAGWDEADACAAGLSGDSRLIYDRVKPKIVVGDKSGNEARIKSTVKQMVSEDEIAFLGVKGKTKRAVACLQKVNS
ncbi:MAG: hypothetical protein GY883_20390 [Shimia sp.]|nr:hypothetical protein [Shimia sp.]